MDRPSTIESANNRRDTSNPGARAVQFNRWRGPLALAGLALAAALALWTQRFVHPNFGLDLQIYLDAASRAASGGDPYQPFFIGTSFIYPPPALLLFAPFASLSLTQATLLWRLGSGLAYLAALAAVWVVSVGQRDRETRRQGDKETRRQGDKETRRQGDKETRRRGERAASVGGWWSVVGRRSSVVPDPGRMISLLALALVFAPHWEALYVGQVDSLVLLGLALFLLGVARPRWGWAGDAGLALAIVLKISPALLLLLPLLRGDWARLLRVGMALALAGAATLLWPGPQVWPQFALIAPRLVESSANPFNMSVGALAGHYLPAAAAALLGRLTLLGLLAAWAGLCVRGRRGDPTPTLAAGVAIMVAASGLVWYHHLAFLIIPAAMLILRPGASRGAALALIALALIQADRLIEFSLGLPPWPAVIGYLIIVAASVALALRQPPGVAA